MPRAPLLATGVLLASGALFFPVVLRAGSAQANKVRCANNLRQLGLAAVQYADDKRYFPHVRGLRELDGDVETADTPRVVRALLWLGYHDDPEGFVCPDSDDFAFPLADGATENTRAWSWGGTANGDTTRGPLADGAPDRPLAQSTQLSYGWTRRPHNANVRSTAALAADRAVRDGAAAGPLRGNHDDGWNVVHADCTVEFLRPRDEVAGQTAGAWLVSAEEGGAALALKPQLDPAPFGAPLRPEPSEPPAWSGAYRSKDAELRLEPRAWSGRVGAWSFRGTRRQGDREATLWGRVEHGALTGNLVRGPNAVERFSARLDGETLVLSTAAGPEEYARGGGGGDLLELPNEEVARSVARAFVTAVRTGNRAAAAAFLSPASVTMLEQRGDWFAELQRAIARSPGAGEGIANETAARVRTVGDVPLIDLVNQPVGPGERPPAEDDSAQPDAPPVDDDPTQLRRERPIAELRSIASAQSLFREGDLDLDGELDYARSVLELVAVGLIPAAWASEGAAGYRFELCAGSEAPEFLWQAVANPIEGNGPAFTINQTGVIFMGPPPLQLDKERCEIQGAEPIDGR